MSDDEFVVENIFPQIGCLKRNRNQRENLFMPIRIAVSGEMHGSRLPDTIFLLGRKSIKHIDCSLQHYKNKTQQLLGFRMQYADMSMIIW